MRGQLHDKEPDSNAGSESSSQEEPVTYSQAFSMDDFLEFQKPLGTNPQLLSKPDIQKSLSLPKPVLLPKVSRTRLPTAGFIKGCSLHSTKYPRNYCAECGYQWFPKGAYFAGKCPQCKASQNVGLKMRLYKKERARRMLISTFVFLVLIVLGLVFAVIRFRG